MISGACRMPSRLTSSMADVAARRFQSFEALLGLVFVAGGGNEHARRLAVVAICTSLTLTKPDARIAQVLLPPERRSLPAGLPPCDRDGISVPGSPYFSFDPAKRGNVRAYACLSSSGGDDDHGSPAKRPPNSASLKKSTNESVTSPPLLLATRMAWRSTLCIRPSR